MITSSFPFVTGVFGIVFFPRLLAYIYDGNYVKSIQ